MRSTILTIALLLLASITYSQTIEKSQAEMIYDTIPSVAPCTYCSEMIFVMADTSEYRWDGDSWELWDNGVRWSLEQDSIRVGYKFGIEYARDTIRTPGSGGGGGSVSDGDKGDVIVSGGGTTWSVERLNAGSGKVIIQEDREPVIEINNPVSDATGSGNAHAIQDLSEITRTGNMAYNSYDARVSFTGAGNVHDHYAAFQSIPTYRDLDSIKNHYAFYDRPILDSSRVFNRYGVCIENPINQGGGIVNNNYGLYVGSLTGEDNAYSIYTTNGKLHFQRGGNSDTEMARFYRPTFSPNSIQYLTFDAFTNTGGRLGFRLPSVTTSDFVVQNTTDGTNKVVTLESLSDGKLKLPLYGDGNLTGTPAYFPAFDSNGNIIERSNTELFDDIVLGIANRIPIFKSGGGFKEDSELTATDDVMRVAKALRLTQNPNGISMYSSSEGYTVLGDFVGPAISMNNSWVFPIGVNMGVSTSGNNVIHTATLGSGAELSGIVINQSAGGGIDFYAATGLSTTAGSTISSAYRRMSIAADGTVDIYGDLDVSGAITGSGLMSSFTASADTGTPAEIGDSETLAISGGEGIDTEISGNTVTTTLDLSELTVETSLGGNEYFSFYDSGNMSQWLAHIDSLLRYFESNISAVWGSGTDNRVATWNGTTLDAGPIEVVGSTMEFTQTTATKVNVGTTAQRPTAAQGYFRFNSTTDEYEGSTDGSNWTAFAMGASNPFAEVFSGYTTTGSSTITPNRNIFIQATVSSSNTYTLTIDDSNTPAGAYMDVINSSSGDLVLARSSGSFVTTGGAPATITLTDQTARFVFNGSIWYQIH